MGKNLNKSVNLQMHELGWHHARLPKIAASLTNVVRVESIIAAKVGLSSVLARGIGDPRDLGFIQLPQMPS